MRAVIVDTSFRMLSLTRVVVITTTYLVRAGSVGDARRLAWLAAQ